MIVKGLEFQDCAYGFQDGGYVMSYASQKEVPIRVVRLETGDGHVGWGEIVRKPSFDPAVVAPEEDRLRDAIIGAPLSRIPTYVREAAERDESLRGFAFGIETAFLDYVARKSGVPLYALLGGKGAESVPEYYSLSCGDPATVASTLASKAKGWSVVQIKLGAGDRQSDTDRIASALSTLADDQTVLADFNGALDVDAALSMIAEFRDSRIIWEEPCKTVRDNTEVAQRSGRPVMFDQCLADLGLLMQVAAAGVAHAVVIKPAYLGGLEPARVARDLCVSAKMKMRIDGPWCGHIATAACLHLAAGAPEELLIAGCDLRQPLSLNEDWGGTIHLPARRIAPADVPGHGAAPK